MPQLSSEGESATLASWLVDLGDAVEAGDVIAELETDKSTVELEAPASGTIVEIIIAAGTEDIAPGTLLGTIEEKDAAPVSGREFSSTPLARRAAAHRGLDLAAVQGSGARGRIVEADVLRGTNEERPRPSPAKLAAPESRAPALDESTRGGATLERPHSRQQLSAGRRAVVRRVTEATQQIPHLYLSVLCSMDEVFGACARLGEELEASGKPTKIGVDDLIVKATAVAMRDVPAANVMFAGEETQVFDCVDVCITVATDDGPMTPVVRDVDRKGLVRLAEEIGELTERARSGGLEPEELRGGTLTIENVGVHRVDTIQPILNPPQACILGVGAARERPIVREGRIEVGRMAVLTLAVDHRVIDGAVAAQWLAAVRAHLEDPVGMML